MARSRFESTDGWHTLRGLAGEMLFVLLVLFVACLLPPSSKAVADDDTAKGPAAWLHVGSAQKRERLAGGGNRRRVRSIPKHASRADQMPAGASRALEMPGIAELPLLKSETKRQQWMEGNLRVVCPKNQELIQVNLRGFDAEQSAKIVNAVVQSYLENIVNADYVAKLHQRELVEQSYKETMDQMQKKRELLDKLFKPVNAPSLEQLDLKRKLNDDIPRLLTEVRIRRLDVDLQAAGAEARLKNAAEQSPEALKAKADLAVAEAQRKVLEHARDELRHEAEQSMEGESFQAQHMTLVEEIRQLQNNAEKRMQELETCKLQLSQPQRVQLLQAATAR